MKIPGLALSLLLCKSEWFTFCTNEHKDLKDESKSVDGDFPGGTVVKNPPANAGNVGSSPGLGKSHMPWSN